MMSRWCDLSGRTRWKYFPKLWKFIQSPLDVGLNFWTQTRFMMKCELTFLTHRRSTCYLSYLHEADQAKQHQECYDVLNVILLWKYLGNFVNLFIFHIRFSLTFASKQIMWISRSNSAKSFALSLESLRTSKKRDEKNFLINFQTTYQPAAIHY